VLLGAAKPMRHRGLYQLQEDLKNKIFVALPVPQISAFFLLNLLRPENVLFKRNDLFLFFFFETADVSLSDNSLIFRG